MSAQARRRQHLGAYASAALPLIWEELSRRGWSHARLAGELAEPNARIARMLYGDRRPGRSLSAAVQRLLGTPFEAWEQPCPVGWQPRHDSADDAA